MKAQEQQVLLRAGCIGIVELAAGIWPKKRALIRRAL
jgi:hypothetical protein